jgi:two-component system phosphate regulon response regulator PhoB
MAQILLVEPDTVLAKTYATALQRSGHHILRAQDAQSAINATDAVTPDCIVLEIQLPSHNGVEFLYELRSHADWQQIPVIILSQLTLDRINLDQTKMEELGVKAFCYKPDTSLMTLEAMIEQVLQVPSS